MTRSFDVFDRDDFRSPDDPERGTSGGSESFWSLRVRLSQLHRKEEFADARDREDRDRSRQERPPVHREERVREILTQRVRTIFRSRDKTFELRDSETHLLSEAGKFRVVAQNDLAEFAYNGERNRLEHDIENLERQGLAEVKMIPDIEHNAIKVVTLTKEGNRLLRQGGILEPGQRTYHGLKKPNEAAHDADLYRLYHKVSDEIEGKGGRVVRVRLDYELKDELYSSIAQASKLRHESLQAIREEMAESFHLKVVDGKIPIPDLRIEYVNENDWQLRRKDLELATDHYRPRGLSEKARAGFQVYARREDTDRLRRVRDREELMTTIFKMGPMPIQPDQLETLRSFGYTEVESRFLYIVATHSGYFTVRQFLDFAHAKSGKRNAHLIAKLFSQGHATAQRYRRRSCVYHLHSRALYEAIGQGEFRNRRNHEVRHIKARLLALDYTLAHSENEYFETAKAKWRYLVETLKVRDDIFIPEADGTEWIMLPDRFPMGVSQASAESAPVVIFTYVDSEHFGLGPFIRHLRTNRGLYAALPYFEFVYVSTASKEQEEAAELFTLLIQGQGLGDLLRYFDLKTKWDNRQYRLLSEDEVILLSEGHKRYTGEIFAALYYLWKRNQLPKDLRAEGFCNPNCAFKLMTVCGHDAVFGTETKRWGDGWKARGSSRANSPRRSPRLEQQVLPTKANA